MSLTVLFLVSLLPGLAWVWYFYRQDRYEPEPRRLILRVFLFGMLGVFPAAAIEAPFRPLIGAPSSYVALLLASILVIGLTEESVKLLACYWGVYRRADFNEVMDGIIYGVTTGLGFAALENLLYAKAFGVQVAPARAVITCLAHASFTGLAGFYLGCAKMRLGSPQALVSKGLSLAVVAHGLYDFFILSRLSFAGLPGAFVSVAFLVGMYLVLLNRIKLARKLSPFRPGAVPESPVEGGGSDPDNA